MRVATIATTFREKVAEAMSSAVPSSVGLQYYAKDTLSISSAGRRSPEEWSTRAADAYGGGTSHVALVREREDDEGLASVAGEIVTIVDENKARCAFFANLAFSSCATTTALMI